MTATELALYVVRFLAMVLVVFRLARFVTEDTFPPMAWLRRWLIQHWVDAKKDDWADLWSCPHCCGIWLSGFATVAGYLLGWFYGGPAVGVVVFLAMAGAQSLLASWSAD